MSYCPGGITRSCQKRCRLLDWLQQVRRFIKLGFGRPSLNPTWQTDLPPEIGATLHRRANRSPDNFNDGIHGVGLEYRRLDGWIAAQIESLRHASLLPNAQSTGHTCITGSVFT